MPEHPILFGYVAKDGLVRIAPNGTIEERNILGTLMSLANKPTKELVSFLKDNGFLFPVCAGTYEVFDEISLYGIINRLKMTMELMTAANEIRKNYKKICDLPISLLFSKDLAIKTDSMKNAYSSCHHKYVDTLINPPVQLSYSRQQEAFEGDTYSITDCIYGSYALNI